MRPETPLSRLMCMSSGVRAAVRQLVCIRKQGEVHGLVEDGSSACVGEQQ